MKEIKTKIFKFKEHVRVGSSVQSIKQSFLDNLAYIQGKFPEVATPNDHYMALAYTVRDRLMALWTKSAKIFFEKASRTICYFSAEFLLGPQLGNNIHNLNIHKNVKRAVEELGLNLHDLLECELEPGLGNGGLGRLAACYMDSLATLNIPAIGYGVRYEFGIFDQLLHDGWQVESTDKWLRYGNPWEIPRPEICFDVKFGGHTEHYFDSEGKFRVMWVPNSVVKGVAFDTPIVGYKAKNAAFIRLWKAEACESFDFQAFNIGDYYRAVNAKVESENITKVLYPNDEPLVGRKLRLKQQYFFVASSLQDMIRIFLQREKNLDNFHKKYVIQLNDTHPAIGVAELMRLFVDENDMEWDKAWDVTQKTFCYTNHTVMSEAMEKWPLSLFLSVLPRHLEIIYEINQRFLDSLRAIFPADEELLKRLSIIDESGEKYVRMTNLACIGSKSINGVSALHTELLKRQVLRDFYEIWPKKFSNKTNGITPRRFLLDINPRLANLITSTIGDSWLKNLFDLKKLENYAEDEKFQKLWQKVKSENKKDLALKIHREFFINIDPESLFDVQAKRIHEYKRQQLNILHAVALYNRMRKEGADKFTPRTIIFAGKAAPGYFMAKLMIKLVNSVASVVNNDPMIFGRLKILFLPNFNVKNASHIYPAADLSEQISMAGKEASGTGNMKFSLNGALTIGTLDGANVEIREEVGGENFFLFGLTQDAVFDLKNRGYRPGEIVRDDAELSMAIEMISSGFFSPQNPELFKPFVDSLIFRDEYATCADFRSYFDMQLEVGRIYSDKKLWTKISILNVARMGKFSSDRAIAEYAKDIWNIDQVVIN